MPNLVGGLMTSTILLSFELLSFLIMLVSFDAKSCLNCQGLELQASTVFIHASGPFGLYSDGIHSR